jgi:5-(aminomethyl)-3-furanmethanol phosphate kinase
VEAVIKVGGSLAENPKILKALGEELCRIAKRHRIVVVPGGGKFADAVRELDSKYALPSSLSHKLAILAMEQYGVFLSHVFPDCCCCCDSLKAALKLAKEAKVPIFLPSKLLSQRDQFEPSWDVTSDSIAAYIAVKVNAAKAVFVTDVDGIFMKDPKKHSDAKLLQNVSARELASRGERTSVDKFLPNFLMENSLDCYVVNGESAKRIDAILSNQQTVCTRILIDFNNKSRK